MSLPGRSPRSLVQRKAGKAEKSANAVFRLLYLKVGIQLFDVMECVLSEPRHLLSIWAMDFKRRRVT